MHEVTSIYPVIKASQEDAHQVQILLTTLNLDKEETAIEQFKLCRSGDKVIGIGRIRKHVDCLELCSLGVDEEHRGRGIGQTIAHALIAGCNEPVYVVTEIPAYFQRMGFKTATAVYPSLLLKQERCLRELDCNKPVIMIRHHEY